jgi:cytochrome c peroxidase
MRTVKGSSAQVFGAIQRTGPMLVRQIARWLVFALAAAAAGAPFAPRAAHSEDGRRGPHGSAFTVENESGRSETISVGGGPVVAPDNPFFLDLGVNGRRCVTCHEPANNMSVTPRGLRARFEESDGTDPIFRTNDGANSPLADVSTVEARRAAYSMLLTKGLIRVGLPVPATAEFELVAAQDPYHHASSAELSLFRRPLPATNLAFLSAVMWDGRETLERGSAAAIHFDLADQSNAATQGHAQAPAPISSATREEIVAYEMSLFTAQVRDHRAGDLDAAGADGGPERLSLQPFVFGENDPLGCDPSGAGCDPSTASFTPVVFTEFDAWKDRPDRGRNAARAAVARGQELFNTRTLTIDSVSGINDDFFGGQPIPGTCTVCHDAAHAGNHSVPTPLDIGIADPPGADGVHNAFGLPVGDMPVYTLRDKATGAVKIVTDPGRALVTGKWKDVGRFKGPILRGLAGRAPYFHNGSAATLLDVVNFYDRRFNIGLTEEEKADLVAFLRSL